MMKNYPLSQRKSSICGTTGRHFFSKEISDNPKVAEKEVKNQIRKESFAMNPKN